jgi:hypothetical protein
MIAHKFERWEINRPVDGFRCANLSCRIVYIDGNAEGFYTLELSGELTPYPGSLSLQDSPQALRLPK